MMDGGIAVGYIFVCAVQSLLVFHDNSLPIT
jgi:hypothetical protein